MEKGKKTILKNIEENAIAIGIIIMFIMETVNVVCKFLFPTFVGIPEEISIFAYIWVCFLCASYCTKRGANIIVDALTAKYPKKLQNFLFSTQYLLDAVLSIFFIYGAIVFDIKTKADGTVGVTGIPLWIIYLAPTAGFLLNLFRDMQMFLKTLKSTEEVSVS
ncbi:TRAP transporter small permease [Eubacterium sp. MSJ-13]|uniref:TRAP transporter small permease n=1 Tax=Eubacterium sp. MSJ-13 TaxID=2841513 RepID=UPI001C12188A|nr:TRAP transporter small permease subunit [Eubacterium sp. MSJ-13]MBU5478649.1 TRAP transporter small permease [Eubacterium sp. MSJ-13]